jgi:hypothetical protein
MQIFAYIGGILVFLKSILDTTKQFLDIFRGGLETGKEWKDLLHDGTKAIEEATKHKEGTHLERVQAASELIRSAALPMSIEAGFRLGMGIVLTWMFMVVIKAMKPWGK